ncbi:MAG: TolC family protein [Candidatus Gastranaerophilales bacterium]|nr:TolC family protein [Candidatus Gastranaerophilales bacterium]
MDKNKKIIVYFLAMTLLMPCTMAIEDNSNPPKKSLFSWFKKSNNNANKKIKSKKLRVEEIKLPPVVEGRPKIPFSQLSVMTIEDCVDYAIAHNPNLKVSLERVKAAKAGIGEARSNYAPRLTGRVSYNHNTNHGTRIMNTQENSIGFNVGISDTIWDFGKTTAKINMAKYDTLSSEYDHTWEELNIIYEVKTNYYRVLMSLADLDIYEQNVRIQTLNYERTKAMFDEGLKSKIDVVNAEVNLTDAKIQLVEGQNNLQTNIIALKNSMYYQEDDPFVVKNTENFGFLRADYRKKIESTTIVKPMEHTVKRNEDGLIMLSSGIEHNDIIQNFEFKPYTISKEEAVKQALELRPDLKSSEMLVNVQSESLKAIKRQYMPEISGDLTWGYTKTESTYSSPLQVGASMGLGSINPYGIHYQIKEGESYLDIALHNLNIAKSDIYWEVQQNYVNMRQLERKIPLMNLKVKATLENFELADGRYSVGLNNYVELQDALKDYNTAQLNFVEAVFNYNVARETLLKSMGVK